MKTPAHHLKNKWHQREQKAFWLGSGINDKHGHEIFEGDKVVFGEHDTEGVIVFKDAMFKIAHGDKFTVLGNCPGFIDIEVIGHIEEVDQ